jgi:hypothetical protein
LLTRGEAVSEVVTSFDLADKNHSLIKDCLQVPDDCFFVFSVMSDYDDIRFSPLILYPDVFPANKYYNAINTATILGLVHGYLGEQSTPFHPEDRITRIQGLKMILGAAGLMTWKDKFELIKDALTDSMPPVFADVNTGNPKMWWYERYIDKACEINVIDCNGGDFRPDETITKAELAGMVSKTLSYDAEKI